MPISPIPVRADSTCSSTINYSNYNSFQASWNKQSGHFNWLFNYTFSKALGIRGENTSTWRRRYHGHPNNYGVLPNDRTHIFNVACVYQMGNPFNGNRLLKGAINGWQVSGTHNSRAVLPCRPSAARTSASAAIWPREPFSPTG